MLTSLPLPYHNKRSPAHSGDELPFLGDELQNRGARGASAGGREREKIRKRQPFAKPAGGPMKSSAPTQAAMAGRRAVACRSRSRRPYALHCRAGVHARRGDLRRVTPLFCVSAAPQGRGGVRQTGRVLAKAGSRHPSVGFADITGLRCPHRAACAEAHLRSATAAPAPSRCIRRRRRSTPQPLTGEPSGRQSPQSLPCKGRWMRRKAQTEGCIAG